MWTFTYRLLALTWIMLCYLNASAQTLKTTSTYPVVNAFDIPENSNTIITFNQEHLTGGMVIVDINGENYSYREKLVVGR